MKAGIIFVMVAALSWLFPVEWAAAAADHKTALYKKQKEIQAWNDQQDKKLQSVDKSPQRSKKQNGGSMYMAPPNDPQQQRP
jgi:hypothetical protein